MAKSTDAISFWGEAVLQSIWHLDNLCAQAYQGRGVWVSTPAIMEALKLKRIGKHHREVLKDFVENKVLEHRQVGKYKIHEYKMTEQARVMMTDRLNRACAKCTLDEQQRLL